MGLSKVELVRRALAELGEASPQEVAAFLERRHGVRIDARFIPFVRASVLEQEMLERARQAARAAAAKTEGALAGPGTATDAGNRPQEQAPLP
jgi:hypothetical protein